jgi:hypothetical protein
MNNVELIMGGCGCHVIKDGGVVGVVADKPVNAGGMGGMGSVRGSVFNCFCLCWKTKGLY